MNRINFWEKRRNMIHKKYIYERVIEYIFICEQSIHNSKHVKNIKSEFVRIQILRRRYGKIKARAQTKCPLKTVLFRRFEYAMIHANFLMWGERRD